MKAIESSASENPKVAESSRSQGSDSQTLKAIHAAARPRIRKNLAATGT